MHLIRHHCNMTFLHFHYIVLITYQIQKYRKKSSYVIIPYSDWVTPYRRDNMKVTSSVVKKYLTFIDKTILITIKWCQIYNHYITDYSVIQLYKIKIKIHHGRVSTLQFYNNKWGNNFLRRQHMSKHCNTFIMTLFRILNN